MPSAPLVSKRLLSFASSWTSKTNATSSGVRRRPSLSTTVIQSGGGGRAAVCFAACGPLRLTECQITSAPSGGQRPGGTFKGNPLWSCEAHLAPRGASHCETDGKTVGLGEASSRLRGRRLSSAGARRHCFSPTGRR